MFSANLCVDVKFPPTFLAQIYRALKQTHKSYKVRSFKKARFSLKF